MKIALGIGCFLSGSLLSAGAGSPSFPPAETIAIVSFLAAGEAEAVPSLEEGLGNPGEVIENAKAAGEKVSEAGSGSAEEDSAEKSFSSPEKPDKESVEPVAEPIAATAEEEPGSDLKKEKKAKHQSVYVIPIQEAIAKPTLYIVRRGLKDAINNNIDVVVLDMNTPGGRVDVTLKIMEMLDRFEGETITYANVDAISAGAFIASSTNEIYFAPRGQIGAAAVILETGKDVPETAKKKIESYMRAKVRNYSKTDPYRAKVVRAMMDVDYVFKIGEEVIKPEGELLTLTADEAMKEYGDPPKPLLGAGIAKNLNELLEHKYGKGNYTIKEFNITWSESLAQYMGTIAPLLLGLGLLCLFIEFKTPGFGIFGGTGIALLLIVFASNYVAGLAGYEPVLLFFIGIFLIGVELFLLPGTVFPGFLGGILIFASLIWSMADIWPGSGGGIEIDPEGLWRSLYELLAGIAIALGGALALWRFLPHSWIYEKLVLSSRGALPDPVTAGGGSSLNPETALPDVGSIGIAATDLHPVGVVEIGGKRYQAVVNLGALGRGSAIIVIGYRNFALLVDRSE